MLTQLGRQQTSRFSRLSEDTQICWDNRLRLHISLRWSQQVTQRNDNSTYLLQARQANFRHCLASNFWCNIRDSQNGTRLKLNQHLLTWLTTVPRSWYYFKFHAQIFWFVWVTKLEIHNWKHDAASNMHDKPRLQIEADCLYISIFFFVCLTGGTFAWYILYIISNRIKKLTKHVKKSITRSSCSESTRFISKTSPAFTGVVVKIKFIITTNANQQSCRKCILEDVNK